MSKALSIVGKVAGIAAMIPGPHQPIAAAIATAANIISPMLARKPGIQGTATSILIGANVPSPYMMGKSYSGGRAAHKTGYGPTVDKIRNPYLAMAVIYSVGGPIAGYDQYLADFSPLMFDGNEATGYFDGYLYREISTGPALQATALAGPHGAIPGWGTDAKLSGKAHALWSAKWDAKNGKYNAGLPQLGVIARGVLTWDPRADSTYPGGSGAQRWASPTDRAAFDAAKDTWVYTARPGLHGLRYALGTWERDMTNPTSDYVLTFGIGLPLDQIVVEDFVELENICDLNEWEVAGTIEEPGDKWANMKRILEAGGAEPCWKGGRLGVKVTAPRIALDTITRSDLAGGIRAQGCSAWRERINTVIPQYTSPDHKWQLQPIDKITVEAFLAEDGEEKPQEQPFQLVKHPVQASQLATYKLYDSREFGPIDIPILPRLRHYRGGDRLNLEQAIVDELGIPHGEVIVLQRSFDPGSMTGTLTVMGDTAAKHTAALASTGIAPPAIIIPTPEERDGALTVPTNRGAYRITSRTVVYPLTSDMDSITIEEFSGVLEDGRTVEFPAGDLTGLDMSSRYAVFWNLIDGVYSAVLSPATDSFADSGLVFLGWMSTSDADGVYPTEPTPPGGWGGTGGSAGNPIP